MGRTTEASGRLASPPDASDVIVAAEPAVPSEPSLPSCSGDSLVPGASAPTLRSSMPQPARLETSAQAAKRAATQACREELESTRLYTTHDAKTRWLVEVMYRHTLAQRLEVSVNAR
jgi:hypothetical protein